MYPADLGLLFYNTTFNVISNFAIGEPFGGLGKVELHPWIKSTLRAARFAPYVQLLAHWGLADYLVSLIPKRRQEEQKARGNLLREKVDACLAGGK